ncbi:MULTISPECIES: hypothetical protein [unclassified Streptomyces]|nr:MULTISPECIES: hypothetical protein [unclassified Streptomyces]MDF3148215.1 hypothetical protein [Streptomyces sp. T21Q-yed]WDF43521.1 hypothetical protein PBV52_45475 [Streptomyces sp. T12]
MAADRMRDLAVPQRQSWQEAVADYYATAHTPPGSPAAPPPSGRTR